MAESKKRQAHQDLVQKSRERGLRVTAQRWAVYEALLSVQDHPGPEAVYRRLRRRHPSLSRATVYKVLDTLVGLGLVREVPVSGDHKRFDANRDRHHHLVCMECRDVMDLYDPRLDRIGLGEELDGFQIADVSVQVTGLCKSCARRSKLPTRNREN